MTKRGELLERYAEYEREMDRLKETVPKNEVLEIDGELGCLRMKAVYIAEHDTLEITKYANYYESMQVISLSGEEAEKLYHFLGGLYG
jgi:hypothetical protein